MVELASLPHSIVTFITHKAQIRPRLSNIRCSIRVPVRRVRRKNYLRPKILKTLTKPYSDCIPELIPEEIGSGIEPNGPAVEVLLENELGNAGDIFVEEEMETSVGGNMGGLKEVEVVKGVNMVGFKGVSGKTMFRVVASFVGLFVLQTVVSVWVMGSRDSDEEVVSLGVGGRYEKEVGLNSSVVGDSGSLIVDEDKVNEIRRMARAVREAERKKKSLENGGVDLEDVSDEEEDVEIDGSVRSAIAKEIDGRLTQLRKGSSVPLLNVNILNQSGNSGKEAKHSGVVGREEDDRLIFEAKRKFRSQLTTPGDKPKGFQSAGDVKETSRNTKDEKHEMNNLGTVKGGTESQHLMASEVSVNLSTSDTAERKSGKGFNSSSTLRGKTKLIKGISQDSRPDRAVGDMIEVARLVRDSLNIREYVGQFSKQLCERGNGNTLDVGARSKESSLNGNRDSLRNFDGMKASKLERRKDQPDSDIVNRRVSVSSDKHKKDNNNPNLWWSSLPCVFVILMLKGRGNEALQGFYTLHIKSDSDYPSSYTVAFEDQNDAKNFSYILDSVFGDLPDAAVGVAPMPTKELEEVAESLNKRVIVVTKGELKLYAGQALADAESALKSFAT